MKMLFLVIGLLLAGCDGVAAGPREVQWKQVDAAVEKGLPKTAVEILDAIAPAALKEKAYGEAVKAITEKIALEGVIQGNREEEKIIRLEAVLTNAPAELKPLMETILAEWYFNYFQQNRWRFLQRTATAEAPGKDFTTWDLPRLIQEIDRHFVRALSAAAVLKKTPVSTFDDLIEKGTVPDAWRPTLYDFIAQEAIAFYATRDQMSVKPEDAFEISADSPMLGSVENFLAWLPETADTEALKLKAIRLYQDLLRFHQKAGLRDALASADLDRLVFGNNVAYGESKTRRFQAALREFAQRWSEREIASLARWHWAESLQNSGDLAEARQVAMAGAQAFPNSVGGKLCGNLVVVIEQPAITLSTERVWNDPLPQISVRYKNLTRVYFRAVAGDWSQFLAKNRSRPESLNDKERKELLGKAPAFAWSANLPPTDDFKERIEAVPAPARLKPGFYFILASCREDFAERDNQLSYTDAWVSDLALVVRSQTENLEGFVLGAHSGEPLEGAEVMGWRLDRNGNRIATPAGKTDANGWFSLPVTKGNGYLVRAQYQGRELAAMDEVYAVPIAKPENPRIHVVLFTDRAIYRPGQTIQYKGVILRSDTEKNRYETLGGRGVEIGLLDPNQNEVARATHSANDYGSFSGSFTAPRQGVTGTLTLRVRGGEWGQTCVQVEEYKRPKFQVTLDAPKVAAKLGDSASVTGKAEHYTGAPVDGATVKYRVVRQARWPYWRERFFSWPPLSSEPKEIAHGTVRAGADGAFKVAFTAQPDPRVAETDEAFFQFTVSVDATDSAGETRSAERSLQVGFAALQAVISAEDWQVEGRPVATKLTTTTLDGEPQAAAGVVKIHRLKEPAQVQRAKLSGGYYYRMAGFAPPPPDGSDPNQWELGEVAVEQRFTTDAKGEVALTWDLGAGAYRAMVETRDRFGKKVTARLPLMVAKPEAAKLKVKIPHWLGAPSWTVEPGQEFLAVWGTGYESGRAFVELERKGKIIERYWTQPGRTQQAIKRAVTEELRGGFTLRITQVRENRAYLESRTVEVPWSNKKLAVKWEHFVSKMEPGQKETLTAVITGPEARKAVAEMVATLYDASLDAFAPHVWQREFDFFDREQSWRSSVFCNSEKNFQFIDGHWERDFMSVNLQYRRLPDEVSGRMRTGSFSGPMPMRAMRVMSANSTSETLTVGKAQAHAIGKGLTPISEKRAAADARVPAAAPMALPPESPMAGGAGGAQPGKGPDLGQVSARKNLNETAFFFPRLLADNEGAVRMTFTMPEALTQWRFMGFAHDRQCRAGFLEDKLVTAKDLMVQPNPPRFLREGDVIELAVKVANQSAARQTGKVRLTFNDALTGQPADASLGNAKPELAFDIPARESRSFSWRVKVPDGGGFLTYKAVGSTGRLSDGEAGYLPVLSRRVWVTESLPLSIRDAGTRQFSFAKLLRSGKSKTLQNQSLTVQMVSNPAWYAVLALPYLMEYPHECTEQTFNRLYANALARTIANSDPRLRRVFEQWKGTPALDSPLEKNQDLKSVLIEETPWLRDAQKESQARRNVGVLFDANRLNDEMERVSAKLAQMQLPDGLWPWFPEGRGSEFITLYIVSGFGRLRHLSAASDVSLALKALPRLDAWMDERYREILKSSAGKDYVPGYLDALYFYARSFFLKDQPLAPAHQKMAEFFLGQARRYGVKDNCRLSQGQLALALKRWGGEANLQAAADLMRSLKERSVSDAEMGRFWRDTELSWWWYRAPIETQALMIEAFDEVAGDSQAVEDCRGWLLKQKQTRDWKTTKATADAVYALLLRGRDSLASDPLVEVSLGGKPVRPEPAREASQPAVEAGTGFYEQRFAAAEINPGMGEITVKKSDPGVAWGGVHWQYLEDVSKVTPSVATPLRLKKTIFTKVNTAKGPVLEAVKGALHPGDELVVRIELRADRDMEYVHLKDQRGSGVEPVNVLSRHQYQDGLAYYESTRDTASHFFIEYLPKGVYVFEYSTRVQQRGQYQTGLAEIQCLYAPEFNSHSESFELQVK
jgi:hypothetical protein